MSSPRTHTLTPFTEKLDQLRNSVLLIASLAKTNLKNSIRGLFERDDDYCNNTIADDEEIDLLEMQIDSEGLCVMSRFQPVASDLREVVSAMKIGANIERIGDQTVNIARRARKINEYPEVDELQELRGVIRLAMKMFHDAIEAYEKRDGQLALDVKIQDKELDRLNKELNERLILRMQDDSERIPIYINIIFISRCLERIGDHSANIAEDVVFAVSAEDIRHLGSK
ncbi:MAG: phosphate transport system regulatory protein PhoU [Verrucomicrobia bacterium RIFCSPHIGHO2_12_FULL_41_10]|nr:MAG: phosphate transport system regulatory protein PhoU [Verrucomicrobia bacterium RIFCSPHIGHO2_12_FULL_41_10]HLB32791.1 phosphate signaling complex protein PhoU [Chthoniobacterales bacterium]